MLFMIPMDVDLSMVHVHKFPLVLICGFQMTVHFWYITYMCDDM